MTETNIKSVINKALVKDNLSRAGMANAISYQELCECIKTATESLTEQQNTIGVISVFVGKYWIKKSGVFFTNYWR